MRVNVAGLLKSPTGAMRDVEVDVPIDLNDGEAEAIAPVRGSVRLIRDHAGVLATGELSTTVRVSCARCLAPVELDVGFELEEEFRPLVSVPGGPPAVKRDEWEAATQIDERNTLDLAEVVRQSVLVAVPLHPLCRAECAGLCAQCGSDLNAGPCECQPARDPRWAALESIVRDEVAVAPPVPSLAAGRAGRRDDGRRIEPGES